MTLIKQLLSAEELDVALQRLELVMREWAETRREGTDCGPIDWNHPDLAGDQRWRAFFNISFDDLRAAEATPGKFQATDDGGSPHIGWRLVISVRMYDGWPYWKPKPALLVEGAIGPQWIFVESLTGLERLKP